jgi:hypothetical protein
MAKKKGKKAAPAAQTVIENLQHQVDVLSPKAKALDMIVEALARSGDFISLIEGIAGEVVAESHW